MATAATTFVFPAKPHRFGAAGGLERFIGLDVHKKSVVAAVLDAAGRLLHRETFPCTRAALQRFAARWLGEGAAVALEATSNSWAVVNVLRPLCRHITVSNPMRTRAIASAAVKTDKVDSLVLAQLLRCDYLPAVWVPDEHTRMLRQLTGRRTALSQDRTAVKNRLHSVLAGELIEVPVADLYGSRGMAWLKQLSLDELSRQLVDSDLRLLEALDRELAALDAQLAKLAYHNGQARLLMTLPGVDYTVAMTLLAALGNISRFADGDHAASYLGLAPSTRQSADHCYHGPITKAGNVQARWMLTEAAQHLDRHPGPLGVFFRRLARKKCRNVAVVATARKLVCIALMMLRSNEPYRYAQPTTVAAKLARLRLRGGGERRVGGTRKGEPRHPNYGSGAGRRIIPALDVVYSREGLPAPRELEALPAGEKKMLQREGLSQTMAALRQASSRPRSDSSRSSKRPPPRDRQAD